MAETLSAYSATADEPIELAFGTVAPGTSADIKFRVHNGSDKYFAVGIGAVADETALYLSTDGVTFTAQCLVGDLPPQGTSPTLTLRRVTARAAADGATIANLAFTVTEWRPAVDVTTPA